MNGTPPSSEEEEIEIEEEEQTDDSERSLEQRLDKLEQRLIELEQRLTELDSTEDIDIEPEEKPIEEKPEESHWYFRRI